ncbi:response regulator [Peribacillus simplex]|uniref:Response regulatory domain-containing protein n=1 Tax=Peribacillus simplex NBRC 15720 = DSM 1321 TaxID=1349754 RepID=A0A223EEW9_9BACI|nr:response regulator [Peribacillus simplex]ASS93780.1 hypothetical protein BS1321_07225 [Peribacillus simplex NBRC 15720 = DSM 1321]MEC1399482.1 response regulator [Peribacillus simplex]
MFKIMIIEDDEKIRKIVADTLTKWKYEVVEVMEFDHILDDFEKTSKRKRKINDFINGRSVW